MNALSTISEVEMAGFSSYRDNASQDDLLARLDTANKTIRTLEKRLALQEKTYMVAMQEKNRKIRELQASLQRSGK